MTGTALDRNLRKYASSNSPKLRLARRATLDDVCVIDPSGAWKGVVCVRMSVCVCVCVIDPMVDGRATNDTRHSIQCLTRLTFILERNEMIRLSPGDLPLRPDTVGIFLLLSPSPLTLLCHT